MSDRKTEYAYDQEPPVPHDHVASMQLVVFRHKLKEVAAFSTVGLSTLSGVSPKNSAMEELIGSIGGLPTAEEQVAAIEDILEESATLWPDQHVHVIARVVQDLVTPGRLRLMPGAYRAVGEKLVAAALRVAPDLLSDSLVNDSLAFDVLRCSLSLLLPRREFGFPPGTRDKLQAAGVLQGSRVPVETVDDGPERQAERQRKQKANWIRKQIGSKIDRQIEPGELASWLSGAASLPVDLRGRVLALLANIFWNTMRNPANNALNDDICNMIDELPVMHRITPLEAFYNQLNLMPHEFAQTLFPIVSESINRLPQTGNPRFDRSRQDLIVSLAQQGEAFRLADFKPGESLATYRNRLKRTVQPG